MQKTIIQNHFFLMFIVIVVLTFVLISSSQARQFRLLKPILSPQVSAPSLPEGAIPVQEIQKLSRDEVEPLVRQVIDKWNTQEMSDTLSDVFYDKSRLMDGVDTIVPRDAVLRVESVQGIQTLQQYQTSNPDGGGEIVSVVSATVRTQLEFNSPQTGFVRRTGTNELILEITTPVVP